MALPRDALWMAKDDAQRLLTDHYYQAWDCGVGDLRLKKDTVNRGQGPVVESHAKLYFLYHPTAMIQWNGHAFCKDNVDHLVSKLINIKTKHKMVTLDVQPIKDENHFVYHVTGCCTYDDEVTRRFSHVLVIWKEPQAVGAVTS
eukprot:gene20696-31889_t